MNAEEVERLEIVYTALPEPRLSESSLEIVEKARVNLRARQVPS
ncbi:MAG: hypothetical protein V3W50_01525 [Thermoanaerobaculia bacterium]